LANRLDNLSEVHLMPYHPLGKSKSDRLGKTERMEETAFPGADAAMIWVATVAALTRIPVKNGATA